MNVIGVAGVTQREEGVKPLPLNRGVREERNFAPIHQRRDIYFKLLLLLLFRSGLKYFKIFQIPLNRCCYRFTESQYHRMFEFGRDLWRSSGPIPLFKQDHLELVAQDHVFSLYWIH